MKSKLELYEEWLGAANKKYAPPFRKGGSVHKDCVDKRLCLPDESIPEMSLYDYLKIYFTLGYSGSGLTTLNYMLQFKMREASGKTWRYSLLLADKLAVSFHLGKEASLSFFQEVAIGEGIGTAKYSEVCTVLKKQGAKAGLDEKEMACVFVTLAASAIKKDGKGFNDALAGIVYDRILEKLECDDEACIRLRGYASGFAERIIAVAEREEIKNSLFEEALLRLRRIATRWDNREEPECSGSIIDDLTVAFENALAADEYGSFPVGNIREYDGEEAEFLSVVEPFLSIASAHTLARVFDGKDAYVKELMAKGLLSAYRKNNTDFIEIRKIGRRVKCNGEAFSKVWQNEEKRNMLKMLFDGIIATLDYTLRNIREGKAEFVDFCIPDELNGIIFAAMKDNLTKEEKTTVDKLMTVYFICNLSGMYLRRIVKPEEKIRYCNALCEMIFYGRESAASVYKAVCSRNKAVFAEEPGDVCEAILNWKLTEAEASYELAVNGKAEEYISRVIIASRYVISKTERETEINKRANAVYIRGLILEAERNNNLPEEIYYLDYAEPVMEAFSSAGEDKELDRRISALFPEGREIKAECVTDIKLHTKLTGRKPAERIMTGKAKIYKPEAFFAPFYLGEIDSEAAARKNFGAREIEKPVLSTLMTAQRIVLSAPQIADTAMRELAHFPEFLMLLRNGFVSVSLFGNIPDLKTYCKNRLADKEFRFSSMEFLNFTKSEEMNKVIGDYREIIIESLKKGKIPTEVDFIENGIRLEKYEEIASFVEQILLIDENVMAFHRCYYFQHHGKNAEKLLKEWLAYDYDSKKAQIPEQYFFHRVIDRTLEKLVREEKVKSYDRSNYIKLLNKISGFEDSEWCFATGEEKRKFECLLDERGSEIAAPMYDILSSNYNIALSSCITPFSRCSFANPFEIPTLGAGVKSIHGRNYKKKELGDFISYSVSGGTVDISAVVSYIYSMKRIIEESASMDEVIRKLNNSEETGKYAGYDDVDGTLTLAEASVRATDGTEMKIKSYEDKDADEERKNLFTEEE